MRFLTVVSCCLIIALLFGCSDKTTESNDDNNVDPNENSLINVPGDAATIQAAYDMAEDGDTIMLADGIYTGDGNVGLVFNSKSVVLTSQNGPEYSILDCQGSDSSLMFGINLSFAATANTVIEKITISNAYYTEGAGINMRSTSPTIRECIFVNNIASVAGGGAIRCKGASPLIEHCTIVNNSAVSGAGIFLIANSTPEISHCVIAYNQTAESIRCNDGTSLPNIQCTNIYGNAGGDWIDCLADMKNNHSNMNLDPLFCDLLNEDFSPQAGSSLLEANNDCAELIGAVAVVCQSD